MLLNKREIKGQGIKISAALTIDTEELGAQSSSTARAEKGFKPKKITVNLQIRQRDSADLTALVALAESVDENGKATIYNIVDPTANAMKIRQVTFVDNVRAAEISDKRAWSVSFMLAEYQSIPEKKEQRQAKPAVTQQTTDGSVPAPPTPEEEKIQLTDFEEVLKKIEEIVQ